MGEHGLTPAPRRPWPPSRPSRPLSLCASPLADRLLHNYLLPLPLFTTHVGQAKPRTPGERGAAAAVVWRRGCVDGTTWRRTVAVAHGLRGRRWRTGGT